MSITTRSSQGVILTEEEKEAAHEFYRKRQEWTADPSNMEKEQANHIAYNTMWRVTNHRQDRVIAMLKYVKLYSSTTDQSEG